MSRVTVNIEYRVRKDKKTKGAILVIYKGYTKKSDGSIKPNRKKETLDYFLYTDPKTPAERSHNKDVNRKIEAIKGQTLKDLLNNKYGFKSETKGKVNFIEYFQKLTNERYESKGNYGNWDSVLKHLKKYTGDAIPFDNVNEEFCKGFKEHLQTTKTKAGKNLSSSAVASYYNKFRACLNQAVDDGIILVSPAQKVSTPRVIEKEREFLTEKEVKKLSETECRYDVLKRAFLFSCLTGLRWSDIQKLEWSEVQKEGDNWKIVFHQKKTKGLQYHYIPNNAKGLLGEPIEGHDRVFVGLRYSSYMNTALAQWMLRAGITKNITFHCARHTFATMLLTKDVDLFTVSKMLGHSEIRTTQVYAKVIDQKKIDAIKTLDIL